MASQPAFASPPSGYPLEQLTGAGEWNAFSGAVTFSDAGDASDIDMITSAIARFPRIVASPVGTNPADDRTPATQRISDDAAVINVPGLFQKRELQGRAVSTLQEWEGFVEGSNEAGIVATLRDLTDASQLPETAEIPWVDLSLADRERAQPGAIFHLLIGYSRRGPTQVRETFVYFRRHAATSSAPSEVADLLDMMGDGE